MRDYDPTLGRYIQADPLGLVDGPSVYGYALQNPQRYVDPKGLDTLGNAIDRLVTRGVAPDNGFSAGNPVYSDEQVFDEWASYGEENQEWIEELPKCPQTLDQCTGQDWQDPTHYPDGVPFHPGGVYGVRSHLTSGGHGNQCIYDQNGNLVSAPPGAGSSDFRGFQGYTDRIPHYFHDVAPYFAARRLNRLRDYYRARPSVNE